MSKERSDATEVAGTTKALSATSVCVLCSICAPFFALNNDVFTMVTMTSLEATFLFSMRNKLPSSCSPNNAVCRPSWNKFVLNSSVLVSLFVVPVFPRKYCQDVHESVSCESVKSMFQ